MPTNTVTDAVCRLTKPSEKPQKLSNGHVLHLYISPKGAKTWRMAYRLNKKPQTGA